MKNKTNQLNLICRGCKKQIPNPITRRFCNMKCYDLYKAELLKQKCIMVYKKRICLKCDKPFNSAGEFNRLCNDSNCVNSRQ